jgi:hypothetical protein
MKMTSWKPLGLGLLALVSACSGGESSPAGGDGGTLTCVGNACSTGDVSGTPECEAFCNKIRAACGPTATCRESFWCEIRPGECAETTRARLACKATDMGGAVMCIENGWSITGDQCPFSSPCNDGG